MFGFDPITLPTLAMAVALQCPAQKPPEVRVKYKIERITHNYSTPMSKLTSSSFGQSSLSAHEGYDRVAGLGGAEVRVSTRMSINTQGWQNTNQACYSVNSVEIEVLTKPTIYVASEYRKGSCDFNATYKHEMKHVNVSRDTVKKYLPHFKSQVQKTVKQIGMVGPTTQSAQQIQNQIQGKIEGAVQSVNTKMHAEISGKNKQIDSKQEYDRVARECP